MMDNLNRRQFMKGLVGGMAVVLPITGLSKTRKPVGILTQEEGRQIAKSLTSQSFVMVNHNPADIMGRLLWQMLQGDDGTSDITKIDIESLSRWHKYCDENSLIWQVTTAMDYMQHTMSEWMQEIAKAGQAVLCTDYDGRFCVHFPYQYLTKN